MHPKWKTPYVVTAITGVAVAVAAAFLPVGKLADISNAGTLYAFAMVAIAAMMLRRRVPDLPRKFRAPALWVVAPAAIVGCIFLFVNLPTAAMLVLPCWGVVGLIIYFAYARSRSHVGRGLMEVHEPDYADLEPDIPGIADRGRD